MNEKAEKYERIKTAIGKQDLKALKVYVTSREDANIQQYEFSDTPLIMACEYNFLKGVDYLISKGADVNFIAKVGKVLATSPLSAAAGAGNIKIVKTLLKNGANAKAVATILGECTKINEALIKLLVKNGAPISVGGKLSITPSIFITVLKAGKFKLADYLLKKGANIEEVNCDLETPLIIMTKAYLYKETKGLKEKIIKFLIRNGANVNAKDINGNTALHNAKDPEIVRILLKAGANPDMINKSGLTPLTMKDIYKDKILLLVNAGANLNKMDKEKNTIFMQYLKRYMISKEAAELMIDKGAKLNRVNIYGETPLVIGALNCGKDITLLLLRKGADSSKNKFNPLSINIALGNTKKIEKLLKGDKILISEKDSAGNTPLLYALKRGNEETVANLIKLGANINLENNKGETPLMLAASRNMKNMVEALMKEGVDVKKKDVYGRTALYYMSWHSNSAEIIKEMIKRGADVKTVTKEGRTPLREAFSNNSHDVMDILISNGAYITGKDPDGDTMLEIELREGNGDALQYYVKWGIDFNAKMQNGMKPMEYVAENGEHEVMKKLLEMKIDPWEKNEDGDNVLHLVVKSLKSYGSNWKAVEKVGLLIDSMDYDSSKLDETGSDNEEPIFMVLYESKYSKTFNKCINDIACALIDAGAEVNCGHGTDSVMTLAAYGGYVDVVKRLIEKDASTEGVEIDKVENNEIKEILKTAKAKNDK